MKRHVWIAGSLFTIMILSAASIGLGTAQGRCMADETYPYA